MCGRYTQTGDIQQLRLRFEIETILDEPQPRYNISPTQLAAVIVWENGRVLKQMRWGLVPRWAKDEKIGSKMINARAETIAEKPSFRGLLKGRRCLIPADGFFEWLPSASGKSKMAVRVVLKDRQPFAFAGLWDSWKRSDGSELLTYTIITTESNELMRPFHHRMPVILSREDEDTWLRGDSAEAEVLAAILKQYPAELMEYYEVGSKVNSPRNDSPDCVLPTG
jgi:putative SOS response-associated peptidase YedK